MALSAREITVVAGVLHDCTGRVLVAQRPAGKQMAGAWEFPGGKLEASEQRRAGLARELCEELGIEVESARGLIRYKHKYPNLRVDLDVWRVTRWHGEIQAREGQALQWCPVANLPTVGLLSADTPIISALMLPDMIPITPSVMTSDVKLVEALVGMASGGGLICVRQPGLDIKSLLTLADRFEGRLGGTGGRFLLHGDPTELLVAMHALPAAVNSRLESILAGVHVPARFLASASVDALGKGLLLGASCHNAGELKMAIERGATYAFLGNVLETPSHPGQPGIGWQKFEELVRDLPLPVYAIGGLGPEDLETAWAHGAQGIAAIRSLWPED